MDERGSKVGMGSGARGRELLKRGDVGYLSEEEDRNQSEKEKERRAWKGSKKNEALWRRFDGSRS
jgi:hypothetical protein